MDTADFKPLDVARTGAGWGTKLTQERTNPELREEVLATAKPTDSLNELHTKYTQHYETNGFALAAGVGVEYKLNDALAIRVASLDYTRSWTSDLNGVITRRECNSPPAWCYGWAPGNAAQQHPSRRNDSVLLASELSPTEKIATFFDLRRHPSHLSRH